ncbi:type II CAAX prenyl endopeptidase Rce1 family protein [Terricaulis sp.]|uniref:CPBP family intramembrane glutamic endopeptidase n=1 Tax=Terricaulis sp. TaxID=2768686 RepID=UPI0037847BC5
MSLTKKSLVFLAVTFAVSWGATLAGVGLGWNHDPTKAFIVLLAMMFGPAVGALTCAFAFERGRVGEMLGLKPFSPNWWWLGAWLAGLMFAAGAVLFTVLFSSNGLTDPGQATIAQVEHLVGPDEAAKLRDIPLFGLLIAAQAVLLGPLINAPILTFTEELGWRGYLHALWRPFGFWRSSLATGAIWGVWHAPAIYFYGLNYPENRELGIALFIVFCMLLAPVMTLVRDRGGNVVAAGILHGTINAVAGLAALALNAPAFPWNGAVGIGGFITLVVMVAAVWMMQQRASGRVAQQPT